MATDKKQVEIPGRLHSVATEGVVAGANEILDDNKGKNQQEINASVDDSLQENKTDIANEITRATNAENAIKGGSSKSIQNLDSRLSTVEAHDTISMDGGSVVVGTAEDFTNRTTAGDAKIPTVGAILNGADEEPTAGSTNLVKSGGVQNELALGAVYDVSAKNPTAGPNNDGKWESLSALLSDANLNTFIPTAVRKGGMSIKFVQSSDNKYVQYRLKSNTFSTDTEDWEDESTEVQFRVMVEALTYLYNENKALHELLTGKNNAVLPYIKAQTIECVDKMTMGVPDVLESNVAGAPSASNIPTNWNEATMGVWEGCTRRIGQQYVDKTSGKVYYAIKVTGSTSDWVPLN